ncbi:AAWKG family protein [Streptomyces qinzhouensis]|uniref:Cell surface protein n=1 Tax=Streptomyces qinzhouensis TaxID=2599401 RepID=A0A5B8IRN2_9ACTN|nr:AAWKG family protein [Streptomyces qinzhouensis]QDY80309.1 cell surface protein [Streptomyces qinzhouensis]
MAENVVYPADSVDDYWHTAVQVLTGYVMPKRELLFGSLVGNDSIPLMRVEFSDHDGEPSNAVADAVDDLNWRVENSGWRVENTDFVVPFYSGKSGPIAEAPTGTKVKMKKARITLLGTSSTDSAPAGGVVLGGEFKSGLGKDFQGQSKDTTWSNKALSQYSYGGGKALEQLLYNGSTLHFSWNDLAVNDADAVDLDSFARNAQAFDRVAQFFAARTRELKDWEFDLGKQEAAWKGQAAGVFKDLIHGLVRTYESYSEQFPASGTIHSTYGNDLRKFQVDVKNAADRLHGKWDTWQLLTGNPLRWLHDVLLDVTDHVWRHNITKVRYQTNYSPRGYSSGYHYVKYDGFSGAVSPYGMLEQKDTWKKIGEEAIRRWQRCVQDVLSAAGKQALIDVENSFNDQKFPEKITTESVNLSNELAKDQAARDRAEALKAKADAEEKDRQAREEARLAREEAERRAREAEEKARLAQEEAERRQAEAEARAEQRQREAEARAEAKQREAEARAAAKQAEAEAKQEEKEREAEAEQAEAERKQAEKEAEQEARQERLQAEQEQKQAEAEANRAEKEAEQERKQAEAEQRAEQKQAEAEAKQEEKEREAQDRHLLLMNQARADREEQRREQERKQAEAEAKQEEKEAEQEARQERLQAEQDRRQAEAEAKQEEKEREAEAEQAEAERKQEEKEAEQERKQAEQEQRRIHTESEYRDRQEEKEREAEQKQAAAEAKQEEREAEQEARQERLQAEQDRRQAEAEAKQEEKEREAEAKQAERETEARTERAERQAEAEKRAERQLRDLGPGSGAAIPDGLRLPEGSGPGSGTTTLNPDGSVTLDYPDGSSRTIDPSGGEVVTTLPDGTRITEPIHPGEPLPTDLGGGTSGGGSPNSPDSFGAGGEEELYDRVLDSSGGGADHGLGAGNGAGAGMPMLPMGTRINGSSTGGGAEGERVRGTVDDGQAVTTRRSPGGRGQEEVSVAGRGSLATASGGMPYMPPMGGGGGPQTESADRERASWLEDDEDVWGTEEGGAPAVIGR